MRILTCVLLLVITCVPTVRVPAGEAAGPQRARTQRDIENDRKREIAMNKDRAQRIKRDTDKLLVLATELKEYVDKTNENVLSLEVVRKAEEVEKLAKSIRERMKEDYRIPDPTFP